MRALPHLKAGGDRSSYIDGARLAMLAYSTSERRRSMLSV
jgi:hypothetical protein